MLRILSAALAIGAMAGCAGGPTDAIIGLEKPSETPGAVSGATEHDIFVMTTRARSADNTLMYSTQRSDRLGLARVTVSIPPNHQTGQIERARAAPPDPATEFAIVSPEIYSKRADLIAGINRALAKRPPQDRSILVFVHGFNTSYTAAVLRMAQFVEDTGYTGVPVLFSWASHGKLFDYVYDLNSALSARDDLLLANDILGQTNTRAVDIVAHSMGNLLTVEALKQARIEGIVNASGRLRHVVLASADIDIDVFRDQLAVFDPDERRFYVLISADDKALATSRRLAGGVNRVGDADSEALAALGVMVIDMTAVKDTNNLNHTKFANSPEVVQLMGQQILGGGGFDTASSGSGLLANAASGLTSTIAATVGGGGRVVLLP